MNFFKRYGVLLTAIGMTLLFPQLGFCSVESSLSAIQSKLVGTILPLASVLGLVWAGISFVMANQNAKAHLTLAIIGAVIGFGAESIISLIRSVVH